MLEALWVRVRRESTAQARPLQGLIQLAVALLHLRRGNTVGARRMLERALPRLAGAAAVRADTDYERMRQYAEEVRELMETNTANDVIDRRPRFALPGL